MTDMKTACEECSIEEASYSCQDCEQLFCDACNEFIHRNGTRRDHIRLAWTSKMPETARGHIEISEVVQELRYPPGETQSKFAQDSLQNLVAIYWDLYKFDINLKDIQETAAKLRAQYSPTVPIKAIGKDFRHLENAFAFNKTEFKFGQECSDFAFVLTEISKDMRDYSKLVLITQRPYQYKQQLLDILKLFSNKSISILTGINTLQEISIDQVNYMTGSRWSSMKNTDNDVYKITRRKAAISDNALEARMISYLKKLAYEGKIMLELRELTESVAETLNIHRDYAGGMIRTGCRLGKLIQQVKTVGTLEFNMISLKVEKLNQKCLLWVLRSLQKDEMISTEKAIQSRLKEAFDLKLTPSAWNSFIEYALKTPRVVHKKSLSDSKSFSFFSQNDKRNRKNMSFLVKKVKDLVSGSENQVIYPAGEEWISYDQYIKSGDVFKIKQTHDWEAFFEYFDKYFDTDNPEDKAISGGRYGCAQFLKAFASDLKNCSLGKLSYMIQLAIDEELLRYHKTLLVWVPLLDKKCKEDKSLLFISKKAVTEALSQCQEGISLAQLPILLKDKLPFDLDLTKIGFAKLKDFILSIPGIELTSKGKNHPYVKVQRLQVPSVEAIAAFALKKIEESDWKANISQIEFEIFENYGYNFRWNAYKHRSVEDFLKASLEITVTDKGFIDSKHKTAEKYHSYNSSTTSDAYSWIPSTENQYIDICASIPAADRLLEFEEMQEKFIEELLDEEDSIQKLDL